MASACSRYKAPVPGHVAPKLEHNQLSSSRTLVATLHIVAEPGPISHEVVYAGPLHELCLCWSVRGAIAIFHTFRTHIAFQQADYGDHSVLACRTSHLQGLCSAVTRCTDTEAHIAVLSIVAF